MNIYDFRPPPPRIDKETKISLAVATAIFKEVAAISADEAQHFIKHNLGEDMDGYYPIKLAHMIRAYLKHSGQLRIQL